MLPDLQEVLRAGTEQMSRGIGGLTNAERLWARPRGAYWDLRSTRMGTSEARTPVHRRQRRGRRLESCTAQVRKAPPAAVQSETRGWGPTQAAGTPHRDAEPVPHRERAPMHQPGCCCQQPPPPPPCSSYAYVPAALGLGSINFRIVDFGGVILNWSCCVPCVLCDTWALRCMMFMFCVEELDRGMRAFVAHFAPWLSEQYTMSLFGAPCTT